MTDLAPPVGSLPRLIAVEELFADPEFSSASISPDGTRLAYLAPKYGRTQVWVRGVDEEHEDAVCVTHDARRGIKGYKWTDDPRWLLYIQDTDGNEDWHLYRVDLENPEAAAVDLTPMDPGSRVGGVESFKKEPGKLLVGMNRRTMFFDTFTIDLATGETEVYRESPELRGAYLVGKNGETFYSYLADDGAWEYYAVDQETGEKQQLLARFNGPEYPVGVAPVRITPDGDALLIGAYADDSDNLQLLRIDGTTSEQSVVAALPGRDLCIASTVSGALPPTLFVSEKTGAPLAARFVGDRPIITVVDPAFQPVYDALTALSDGVLGQLSSDEEERRWVATFTSDTEPDLTYFYDHETGESRLLFRPYPNLDPADLAPMTGVTITARDGLPLHAFLTLPVGVEPKNLPLVLHVHGGPWWHDTWSYDRETQFFANRGYAVLQVNFRGSTGYGRKHISLAVGELAGTMHDDLIDAATWAVEHGYADPERIGIYGGSYGGYAALVGVTFTPDFFAAAVDYVGISSLANFMRTLPAFVKPYLANSWYRYVGDPEDPAQEARMLARSPITKVDEIRTPLLVVQGANDVRVVKEEADNIVASLAERGVEVEYLVADDEGHGFQNPENLVTMFHAIERHFAEHLGGRSA